MKQAYKVKYLKAQETNKEMLVKENRLLRENSLLKEENAKLKGKIDAFEVEKYSYKEQIGWLRSLIEKQITGESQDTVELKADMEGMKHLLADILHDAKQAEDFN